MNIILALQRRVCKREWNGFHLLAGLALGDVAVPPVHEDVLSALHGRDAIQGHRATTALILQPLPEA